MKKNAHHYVRSVSFKWNAMEIEREKFYHCKVKRGLSISFDDFFGNGSLCNTAIHCLFFYVTVSIRFAHGEFTDQNPFCLVDQTDFSHFFFDGQRLPFKLSQSFSGAFHPVKGMQHSWF